MTAVHEATGYPSMISFWICLNSGVPAFSHHSNRDRFHGREGRAGGGHPLKCDPRIELAPAGNRVDGHIDAIASRNQIEHGLHHADVSLHPGHDDLLAIVGRVARLTPSEGRGTTENHLIEPRAHPRGQLGRGGSQPLRILLGAENWNGRIFAPSISRRQLCTIARPLAIGGRSLSCTSTISKSAIGSRQQIRDCERTRRVRSRGGHGGHHDP